MKIDIERKYLLQFDRLKKAASYLKQINHSKVCQGKCESDACVQTVTILNHVSECTQDFCNVSGCRTTKKLLNHYNACCEKSDDKLKENSFCLICSLVVSSPSPQNTQRKTLSPSKGDYEVKEVDEFPSSTDYLSCINKIPFQK